MSGSTTRDTSAIMRRVKSRDTAPEIAIRKALWLQGIRYRLHVQGLPGKPDLALLKKRIAIFIDGDFWHGGQWRKRKLSALHEQFRATSTKSYWMKKIRRNMDRDARTTASLLEEGWTVLRLWESEIKDDLAGSVETVVDVSRNGAEPSNLALLPQRTVAEFFAGIGLVRLGLERQGWSVKYANDIAPQKEEMYTAHFGTDAECLHVGDIHEVDAKNLPTVTLATASFPCNDLSLAGARKGLAGKQSSAFWGFVRVLEDMGGQKPPLVLIENVPGFLSSHQGEDFRRALTALNRLGYAVDPFVINASHFVPQSRARLFVVGRLWKEHQKQETSLLQDSAITIARSKQLLSFIAAHPEITWSLRPLPTLPHRTQTLESVLEDLPDDAAEWWSEKRAVYLFNQMSERHRVIADRMISDDCWSYGTVFRRVRYGRSMAELRTDGIAGCLRTTLGGSGRQILFKAGHGRYLVRLLTPRECARLMGADDFTIDVPLNQALHAFGDAVCVPVIDWIAEHYLNPVVNEFIRGYPLRLAQGP